VSIEARVQEFIQQEIAYDAQAASFSLEEPLLGSVLDSMAVLRTVVFLEREFGIQVADDELVPENFATIARIAGFVRAKQGGSH
jgi:acyl carrier protein